jgi:hypothetical protein
VRALIVLMLVAGVASAHQSSTKYVELVISGARAEVTLRCAPGDVTEPMKLAPDAKPSASAAAAAPLVPAYVASWLAIRTPADPCSASAQTARAEDDGFVAVHWVVTCPRPIATAILDFTAFFALDKRMEALVRIGDADEALRVTAADSPLVLEVGPHRLVEVRLEEVAIALLILVLVSGARTFSRAARDAAIVLALYLAAHLTGTALVAIPPVLAQIILPATLVYAALEVAARPELRWRAATLVAFGLAHGISRAPLHSTSTELTTALAVGACTIAALPLVRFAAARLTQRRVILAAAGAVCVVASVWLLQLALG